jgi:transposase
MGEGGTSINIFERSFPDDYSCSAYLLGIREKSWQCPCGRDASWTLSKQSIRIARHPCGRAWGITGGTAFQSSTFRLRDIFYTMLLFANSANGLPSTFLQSHLGLGPSSATNLARKVRFQMALIERDRTVGGEGCTVRIETRVLGRIRTAGRYGKGRARLLFVSDGDAVVACVIPTIKRRFMAPFLRRVIGEGSKLVTSQPALRDALTEGGRYKDFRTLEASDSYADFRSSPSYKYFRYLNRCLARTHRSVSRENLWLYVKEFQFRFNRRESKQSIFWELVSQFPHTDKLDRAKVRSEADFVRV